jgi:hypothetical protein
MKKDNRGLWVLLAFFLLCLGLMIYSFKLQIDLKNQQMEIVRQERIISDYEDELEQVRESLGRCLEGKERTLFRRASR